MTEGERTRLDVIESKVDQILLKLGYIEETLKDHEGRLRGVERWKLSIPVSVVLALATVVGAIAGMPR